MTRRQPHPLATIAGMVVILAGIGYTLTGIGWCLAHIASLTAIHGATK